MTQCNIAKADSGGRSSNPKSIRNDKQLFRGLNSSYQGEGKIISPKIHPYKIRSFSFLVQINYPSSASTHYDPAIVTARHKGTRESSPLDFCCFVTVIEYTACEKLGMKV